MDGTMTDEAWREYFRRKNYVGGTDMPFNIFYQDFLRIFPNAKVVMTTRFGTQMGETGGVGGEWMAVDTFWPIILSFKSLNEK